MAMAWASRLRGRRQLHGRGGPYRDIVVLNAAAGILVGEKATDWPSAVEAAHASIDSGAARARLNELIRVSHDS